MRRFIFFLFVWGIIFFYTRGNTLVEDTIPFNSLPQWINQHIEFPQEALKYGTVGMERFVVSLSWNGKPYISHQLNTLNPAIEKAIIDVIEKAPTCSYTMRKDIVKERPYRLMKIDFYRRMPENYKSLVAFVPQHTAPIFKGLKGSKGMSPLDSREMFIEWLANTCCSSSEKLPEVLNKDTLSLVYVVDSTGKVKEANAFGSNEILCKLIIAKAKKSPRWIPSRTDNGEPICLTIKENLIVLTDEVGQPFFLTAISNKVCYNSADAPKDSTLVVINPLKPARYIGDTNIRATINKKLSKVGRANYKASFIVELDGSISGLEMEIATSNNKKMEDILRELLAQSRWIPAQQGGKAVRSRYVVSSYTQSQSRNHTSDYYPDFMMGGDLPPFEYDPSSKRLQKRWSKLQEAYPVLKGDINGYAKSRRLNKSIYKELMIRKGR